MNTKPTIKNFIIVILPALLALFAIFFLVMPKVKEDRMSNENENKDRITNFEECIAAGNPAMESYPRQCRDGDRTFTEEISENIADDSLPVITQEEAILIAGNTSECTTVGIPVNTASYNHFSKTWWIDLERMPELEKDGCHPACVVHEENKTAEVNWRCTGLIEPEIPANEALRQLFIEKYPKYSDTLSINILQETESHARGNVVFVPGAPGGYFLAAKIDNAWQIILDGNGQIPCSLAEYGFPEEMLSDCAE